DFIGNRPLCDDGLYGSYLSGFLRYAYRHAHYGSSHANVDSFAVVVRDKAFQEERSLMLLFTEKRTEKKHYSDMCRSQYEHTHKTLYINNITLCNNSY